MSKNTQTIKAYDIGAIEYDRRFRQFFPPRKNEIKKVFSRLEKKNPVVVELGCGSGREAAVILNYTENYLGVDGSRGMINIAKKKVPSGKFVVSDYTKFAFPREIDVVFDFSALLHAGRRELAEIIKKTYLALNPGGLFYFSMKEGDYKEVQTRDKFGTRYFYYYRVEDVEQMENKFKRVFLDYYVSPLHEKWFHLLLQK